MGTVDVFIGNNLIIDFEIYSYWIDGYTVEECKEQIMKRDPIARETKESIVENDIINYYCVFNQLEQYLHAPPRLKEQLLFQISPDDTDKLINKYYQYDAKVMRELLGYKLTQRQRKDLDDLCDKTGYRVKSVRRQFDNLRRITRSIEDLKGTLLNNIIENFCLPNKMAEQYSAIVFIASNQFEISKKKLNYLTLEDFLYCASQMIKNWTSQSQSQNANDESDFNRDFLINLKDLKILTEKEFIEDHKKLVINAINKSLSVTKENRSLQTIDASFKDLSKVLIDIAYALNHSKDMKDIFVDLVEGIIEPCKDKQMSKNEVKLFLDEYRKRAHQLQDVCRDNPKILTVFDRYMVTVTNCLLQIYHS